MDRSPMRQELSAALSPFRTRVESCNHEALARLVRQAEEAQPDHASPTGPRKWAGPGPSGSVH
ncbi:hypothetical protein ACKVWC_007970 [Pyricularia oryzae]